MPPGLGILLAIIAFYYIGTRTRTAMTALGLAIVISWSFSTTAMGRMMSGFLISAVDGKHVENPREVDAIVVPTSGMVNVAQMGWIPTKESYQRLMVAYNLQAQIGSRTPIILTGGKTHGLKHPSEARVAQQFFDRQRAQITPVILEESSINTYENSIQTASILREREADEFFLVTSEHHMLRALAAFRGRGLDPIPFPVVTLPHEPLTFTDFLPTRGGVTLNAEVLYEVAGLIEYIVTGKVHIEDIFYTGRDHTVKQ